MNERIYMSPQINIIHTPCKQCVFAKYENITQTDCELGYIDAYKKNHTENVLEVYDNDKEFYVINNKKCVGYRENKWFKQFDAEMADLEIKKQIFFEHNRLDYISCIYIDDMTKTELENIFLQISLLKPKPAKVIIIRYPNRISKKEYSYDSISSIINQHKLDMPWEIKTVVDNIKYEEFLTFVVLGNKKHRFILNIDAYFNDVQHIISGGNNIIYHQLETFMVLSNAEETVRLFPAAVYRYSIMDNGIDLLSQKELYIKI